MRISKSHVTVVGSNTLYATLAVAVSMFIFAYSIRFGKLPILVLYAAWTLPVVLDPRILLRRLPTTLFIMLPALLAIASALWSENPSATLRSGIQYASTILCALIAARVVGYKALLVGGAIGSTLVLAYSFAINGYDYDVIGANYAFVGAFESKNQLGFFASVAVILGAYSITAERLSIFIRGFALAVAVVGAVAMVRSESATSLLTLVFALGVAFMVGAAGKIHPTTRLALVLVGAILVAVGIVAALNAGAFDAVLGLFGKDSTLTGRTYLWNAGVEYAMQRPIAGLGYGAFWTQGYAPAEGLWEAFHIGHRTGFHFHNTYIEAAVALGLIGLVVLVGLVVWFLILSLRWVAFAATVPAKVMFSVTIGMLLISRSFVEIDYFNAYTIGTFLLFFTLTTLVETPRVTVRRSLPVRAGPSLADRDRAPEVPAGAPQLT